MKTKIFGLVAIVCIAFAASFIANKVSKSSSALSMVAAANVEALAQRQKDDRGGGGGGDYCDLFLEVGKKSRCYKKHRGLSMIYTCIRTGDPAHYCEPFNYYL